MALASAVSNFYSISMKAFSVTERERGCSSVSFCLDGISKCSVKYSLMNISCEPGDPCSFGECRGSGNLLYSLKKIF